MKQPKRKISRVERQNPPLLTGGLKLKNDIINDVGHLVDVDFDWFTVTVGQEGIGRLLSLSEFHQAGRPIQGFSKSERRMVDYHCCWRKMGPHQSETNLGFGKNYESWEFEGSSAGFIVPQIMDVECKVTRIDIAFDMLVSGNYLPDHWIESVRPVVMQKGLSLGISGQNDINTRYIGSPHSDRRIRVYRKDRQDITIAKMSGPVLRIEIMLRGGYAISFWKKLCACKSIDRGLTISASYIEDMTGFAPIPENAEEVPKLETKISSKLCKRLYHFIKQYGVFFKVLDEHGIDLRSLIDLKYQLSQNNQVAQCRIQSLISEIKASEINSLVAVVKRSIEDKCR